MSTNAQITWVGPGLRLVGETAGGQALVIDHVLPGEERRETGPRPTELILIGMLGCTSMDVVSILQKKRQTVTGVQVKASAERADDHPRVFTQIHLEYIVSGRGVDPKAVERAIELSQTKYCPGAAMLGKTAKITTSYRIVEE
jgi:putative redox protein